MRDLIDPPTPGLDDGEIDVHARGVYIEFERVIDKDNLSLYAGVLPRTENSFWVVSKVTFLLDGLDNFLTEVLTDDVLIETWPTLVSLLHNGINDKYSEGALIKLEDPDTADSDWFVATVVGNVNTDDPDIERIAEAAAKVMAVGVALMVEVSEREPSVMKSIIKGALAGIGLGALAALGISPN